MSEYLNLHSTQNLFKKLELADITLNWPAEVTQTDTIYSGKKFVITSNC